MCHAEKSEEGRRGGIYRKSLASELSREVLELFKSAPKPRQLVWGDGAKDCVQIDSVSCRKSALVHNPHPLPVASVNDRILPYAERIGVPDFVYIDAGDPLDEPHLALPYMGPGWYWRENVSLILEWGRCRAGNVQPSDCKYAFTASDHAPCDALKEVFDKIEEIVVAACARSHLWASEPREYTEDTCRREVKLFILSMIGSWTTQHSYNWRCEVAALEDDVVGRVERWRDNGDGTTKFMSRAETVSNRTMFLIGRIPLDVEHAEMFKLRRVLRRLPVQIHGGVNDCMYVKRLSLIHI